MAFYEEFKKRGEKKVGGGGRVSLPGSKSVYSHDRSNEAMFKVVSYGKSIRAAKDMMEYISKNSEHINEPEPLMDEMSSDKSPDEIDQILEDWNLKKNHENLSKQAFEAGRDEFKKMPEKERLDRRQVMHSVISFPKGMDPSKDEMKRIAQEVLDPFVKAGYEYVAVPHTGADHQHIHIVMKTESSVNGKQLRLNKNDIQSIRERIAEVSNEYGYDLKATRRYPTVKELMSRQSEIKERIEDRNERIERLEKYSKQKPVGLADKVKAEWLRQSEIRKLYKEEGRQSAQIERMSKRGTETDWLEKQLKDTQERIGLLKSQKGQQEAMKVLAEQLRSDNKKDKGKLGHIRSEIEYISRLDPSQKEDLKKKEDRFRKAGEFFYKMRGKEAFSQTPAGKKIKQDPTRIGKALLDRQAPTWYSRHGYAYEQLRTNIFADTTPPKPEKVGLPRLDLKTEQALTNVFNAKYRNGEEAKQRFLELASEKKKMAYWYVNKRPEIFGELKPGGEGWTISEWKKVEKSQKNQIKNIDKFFNEKFQNPKEAKKLFMSRADISLKKAIAEINHDPKKFGNVKEGKQDVQLVRDKAKGRGGIDRAVQIVLPEKWLKEAKQRISDMESVADPSKRQQRHRAAGRIRSLHTERQNLEKSIGQQFKDLLPENEFLRKDPMQNKGKKGIIEKALDIFKKQGGQHEPLAQQAKNVERASSALNARSKAPMTEKQAKAAISTARSASKGLDKVINPFKWGR